MTTFVRIEGFARHPTKQRRGPAAFRPGAAAAGAALRGERPTHTARDIVAEAERWPGHTPHLSHSQPPRILFGVRPREVLAEAAAQAEGATDRIGRKVKRDAVILASAVTSYPRTWEEIRADPEGMRGVARWLRAEVRFWRRNFGDRVRCILLHVDEDRPNLHVLLLPDVIPTVLPDGRTVQVLDAGSVDPLLRATQQAKAIGGGKADIRNAARLAGAELQQRYAREVGPAIGHGAGDGRTGPRLSRFEARVRREVHKRTEVLEQQLAEARRAAQRGERAMVIVAAERTRRAAQQTPAEVEETGVRRAKARQEKEAVRQAALARIPGNFVPRRLGDDGVITVGGPDLAPGEPLRPARELILAREHLRGLEAAVAQVTHNRDRERKRADMAAAEATWHKADAKQARASAASMLESLKMTEAAREAAEAKRATAVAAEGKALAELGGERAAHEAAAERIGSLVGQLADARTRNTVLTARLGDHIRQRDRASADARSAATLAAEAATGVTTVTRERDAALEELSRTRTVLAEAEAGRRKAEADILRRVEQDAEQARIAEARNAAARVDATKLNAVAEFASAARNWSTIADLPAREMAPILLDGLKSILQGHGAPKLPDPQPTRTADPPPNATDAMQGRMPDAAAVTESLAVIENALLEVDKAAPGWRTRILRAAGQSGNAVAAVAAGEAVNFATERSRNPQLAAALRNLDTHLDALAPSATRLVRALVVSSDPAPAGVRAVMQHRNALVQELAWLPPDRPGDRLRCQALAVTLHPRALAAIEPASDTTASASGIAGPNANQQASLARQTPLNPVNTNSANVR